MWVAFPSSKSTSFCELYSVSHFPVLYLLLWELNYNPCRYTNMQCFSYSVIVMLLPLPEKPFPGLKHMTNMNTPHWNYPSDVTYDLLIVKSDKHFQSFS